MRSETERLASSFEWTTELEPARLTQKVQSENISSKVKLSPLAVVASISGEDEKKVFPFIADFSSLDVSLLPDDLKKRANSFCSSLCKKENVDSFMAKDCLYSLALFYLDSEKSFPKDEKWILGSPFIVEGGWEIPVRFGESFDVRLFWINENNSWKIDQIQIIYSQNQKEEQR